MQRQEKLSESASKGIKGDRLRLVAFLLCTTGQEGRLQNEATYEDYYLFLISETPNY